jgi:hypothetical protein
MRRVIVEAPYSGWSWPQLSYVQSCMDDCLSHGEAPMIGYLLYPPRCGPSGMEAALAWESVCEALVVYLDMGMWHNMRQAIVRAAEIRRVIELRVIDPANQSVADRIRVGLRGRPLSVPSDACKHQLDTPVFDSQQPGRVLSWRCGCGAAGPSEEQVKAAMQEVLGGR